MAPIMQQLEIRGIKYEFLYTQQHKVTIDDLLQNFSIKTPYRQVIKRKKEAKTIRLFAGWASQMLLAMFNPFSRRRLLSSGRGLILTHGDTATAAWAAIYGQTSLCKVMHIESGLRSYNILKPFPEELMRLITFTFSNYYVCPNEWAKNNLKWFPGRKLNVGANQMYDALMYALKKIQEPTYKSKLSNLKIPPKYAIVSIHRYENIFKADAFEKILRLLENIAKSIDLVIVLHPVTEKRLRQTGNYMRLKNNAQITLVPRLDFLSFVEINKNSEFVITDGGSNQEEMSYLGKPTLLFRDTTERKEGLGENSILSNFDEGIITDFVSSYKKYERPAKNITPSPSQLTVDWIEEITRVNK